MISAGAYDKPVTFERVTETRDAIGGRVATWATLKSTMARAMAQGGREAVAGTATHSEQSIKLAIRQQSCPTLAPKDRVAIGAVYHDISAVLPEPMGRPVELHITATRSAG